MTYTSPMRTTPLILASLSLLALSACTPADPQDGAMEGMPHVTIGWLLEDKGTDDTGMQTSHVALLVGTTADPGEVTEHAIGDYAGCSEEAQPHDGPLLTLTCWWAGGGDEFQVRMDGTDTLVVSHRGIDEQAEIGEFEDVQTIEIPEGAMIMTAPAKKI